MRELKQATTAEFAVIGVAIVAFSLPTIFYLQAFAGDDAKYVIYIPWLALLAIASVWSALIPIGVAIMLSSNAGFEGLLAATSYLAFAATLIHYRSVVRPDTISKPTLVFLFLIVISCCWALHPLLWLNDYPSYQLVTLPQLLLAFSIAVVVASNTGRIPHLLWIIIGCAMVNSIATIKNYGQGAYGMAAWQMKYHTEGLVHSDMWAGWAMLAGVILVFEAINSERSVIWRVVSVCGAAAATVATVYSGTRSAMVGLAVGCASLILLSLRIRRNILAVMVLAVVGWGVLLSFPTVYSDLEARFTDKTIETGTGRLEIWTDAITKVFPNSPVLGVGWNNFGKAMEEATSNYVTSHNVAVQVLVEFGVVGIAVFTWWCVSLFWFTRNAGAYGSLWRAMLTAVLVQGLFLHPLYCLYFWIVVGLVEGTRAPCADAKRTKTSPVRTPGPRKVNPLFHPGKTASPFSPREPTA
jgi:hypothetical protein